MSDADTLKQIILTVTGDVQRVGYRERVFRIACKTGVTGEVRNLESPDVEIIAEGSSEQLEAFVREINIQEFPIHVESISFSESTYTGSFSLFKIIRGDPQEELAERFDTAIQHLTLISHHAVKSSTNSDILISMMKESLNKQDQMLEKQDQMLEKQDQMLDKQDQVLGKQDHMISEIKGVRSALIREGLMEPVRG